MILRVPATSGETVVTVLPITGAAQGAAAEAIEIRGEPAAGLDRHGAG
jgi:hypothetical protein